MGRWHPGSGKAVEVGVMLGRQVLANVGSQDRGEAVLPQADAHFRLLGGDF